MDEKSTSFRYNLLDVVSISKKSTSFPRNLFDAISMSKNRYFLTYVFSHNFKEQKIYAILIYLFEPNFDGQKVDVVSMYFFKQSWWKTNENSRCWFWFVLERQKIVEVLISVFKKFSIYQKLKPFELHIWT